MAVLFSQEVDQAVTRLKYGDILRLRLGSSVVVEYRLVNIARLKRHQIEVLSSLSSFPGKGSAKRTSQRALCADR
jgi:hypothetical protein